MKNLVIILVVIFLLVTLGFVFNKKYKLIVLERGAKNSCEINGIISDSVQIGDSLYLANENVCGGKIVKIDKDIILISYGEGAEEYKLGDTIGRFSKISLGMTKENVKRLIGEPSLIKIAEYDKKGRKAEVWEYSETFKKGWDRKYCIYFLDNKVAKLKGSGF
ncbi:MAG: outer membrane protein assembly factor BamE [Candidatus Omnitrophica bacterium]|nr:outer membrane protein assembly factor BamE [Candidatus Omnitrophota bacterium]